MKKISGNLGDSKVLNMRLPSMEFDNAKQCSQEQGVSMTLFVRNALEEAVAKHEEEKQAG